MVNSMTGFAAAEGQGAGLVWSWDLRGVNARGLDIRIRLPDRAQSLEPELRRRLTGALGRGSVQVGLRLRSDAEAGTDALDAAIAAALRARAALQAAGLETGPVDPLRLLTMPSPATEAEAPPLPTEALLADFDRAVAAFGQARATEGASLSAVLEAQLDTIAGLVDQARAQAAARAGTQAERYRADVARLVEAAGGTLDPGRLSHDLAALTVRGDVAEELDRLGAHIDAARGLLGDAAPVGRRLDFLMQEFNREANTLCAKSGDTALTQTGLDLKVVIDQMREQVQNVE